MDKLIATHRMTAEDGTTYEVNEFQEYVDASSFDGEDWIEGLKRLELKDGSRVHYIDEDTYRIVGSDMIIRRG